MHSKTVKITFLIVIVSHVYGLLNVILSHYRPKQALEASGCRGSQNFFVIST